MSTILKRIPTIVKIIIIILIPVLFVTLAFYWVGKYYRDDERIYPNIMIAGIDVSWLTYDEALNALDLHEFEQRVSNAEVRIIFPDSSGLMIKGDDIRLTNDASLVVDNALSIGRGRGFIVDTFSFIRCLVNETLPFPITPEYDLDILHSIVDDFTEDYNERLMAAEPLIYTDRIIITKGAGQALADAFILKDLAYTGLFTSFEENHPVEFEYVLPETTTDWETLLEIHNKIFIQVVSAELDRTTWIAEEGVIGVDFDLINAVELLNETETGKTATIQIEYIPPEYTKDYLESLIFRDLIGTETTYVHGTRDRLTNVRISSETINGLVLEPGEEFSFNRVVGSRSASKGYRLAGAYVETGLVTVYGGGVCQTASTIHSAIMDTEIQIIEHQQHNRPIPYLPRGRCATVFWGIIDYKFVNNTDFPIRIDFELDSDRMLTVKVYGTIIDDFPTVPLSRLKENDN